MPSEVIHAVWSGLIVGFLGGVIFGWLTAAPSPAQPTSPPCRDYGFIVGGARVESIAPSPTEVPDVD